MRETRIMMGMPVTVEVPDADAEKLIRAVFNHFKYIDEKFSTYKSTSEIMAINRGELPKEKWSEDMRTIFALAEETKASTNGYFDIQKPDGQYDPSGIVKGWAIARAAEIVRKAGVRDFYVDAGGDIQTGGHAADGKKWAVGIRNPWNEKENVKVVYVSGEAVATSGTYARGEHIYNPKTGKPANEIVSLTVIHEDICEADRFATAAFAMGGNAIRFIEGLAGFEGYMIDNKKMATMTSGFGRYTRE
jgi:FAD:protein FMN transferase